MPTNQGLKTIDSVTVIDYGVTNTSAVCNLLKTLDIKSDVISKPNQANHDIKTIILPGVGNFDQGMNSLIDSGFSEHILNEYQNGAKIIAICLGFQLLGLGSAEGSQNGLGLIQSECYPINELNGRDKAVNNGWGELAGQGNFGHIQGKFYFTHSFSYSAKKLSSIEEILTVYKLEDTDIVAGVISERLAGFQFHPERSHIHGQKLMRQLFDFWST